MSDGRVALFGAALVLASGWAGCGGDDRKERERAYISKLQRVCRETAGRVQARGAPHTLADYPALAAGTFADVERMVRRVDRLKAPPGTAQRVDAFLDDLHAVDRQFRARRGALADGAPSDPAAKALKALLTGVADVQYSAREAGFTCITEAERRKLDTAVRGPLYAAWLERFDVLVVRRLSSYDHPPLRTLAAVDRHLRGRLRTMDGLLDHFDEMESPAAVRFERDEFESRFDDFKTEIQFAVDDFEDAGDYRTLQRALPRIRRRADASARAYHRLQRALARTLPAGPPAEAQPA